MIIISEYYSTIVSYNIQACNTCWIA